MPLLSLGGMANKVGQIYPNRGSAQFQNNVMATLERAVSCGFHHVETARHYGVQASAGLGSSNGSDPQRILQSKVPPRDNASDFEDLPSSHFSGWVAIGLILAIHGINLPRHIDRLCAPVVA